MYLPVFDGLTATEIFNYTRINHKQKTEVERLDKLIPLYKLAFFGPQFTDTQSMCLILYKNGMLRFIWQNDFGKPFFEGEVLFEEFSIVFSQYIEYCIQQKLT